MLRTTSWMIERYGERLANAMTAYITLQHRADRVRDKMVIAKRVRAWLTSYYAKYSPQYETAELSDTILDCPEQTVDAIYDLYMQTTGGAVTIDDCIIRRKNTKQPFDLDNLVIIPMFTRRK